MYERILLAYDGTLEGAVALREGALLAKRCGAKVFILSVVPQGTGVHVAEGIYAAAISHQLDSYKDLLARGVARLRRLGLDPVARVTVGEPVKAICAFAKEVDADLVVVGHQKKGLLDRWWSGSTGAYLSDYIRCSLLIARNQVSDEAFAAELDAAGEKV
ncbi:MAG TPA: universal stress protein [Caulobacteraceae bacterium]|jgi:nucleotide-binding universal stress UspA family protein|nr:universal stress protein [Caulobacteraceae bacterium]